MANVITTKLDLDGKGFTQQLAAVKTSIASADGAVNKLKAGFAGMQQVAQQNAGMIAGALTTAMFEFGRQSVTSFQDGALAAGQFSEATGTSAAQASRLIEVADDVGVSVETMRGAIQRMNKAAADGKLEVEGFGSTLAQTANGSTDVYQSFINTATAIGAIEDPTKRAEAAQQTFGRSYAEIAELMAMDANELKAALEGVSDAQVFTDEEVAQARAFRDAVDQLSDSFTGLKNTAGAELVGNLTLVAEAAQRVIDTYERMPEPLRDAVAGAFNPLSTLRDMWNDVDEAIHGVELDGVTAALVRQVGPTRDLADETERLANAEAERAANAIIAAQANANDPAVIRANAAATAEYTQRLLEMANSLEGIPAEKYVEIKAAIDSGDYQRAQALLNALAADRVARLTVLVSAQMGGQMGQVGSGVNAAVAAAAAAGRNVGNAYSSAIAAAMNKGGGGGGGGGASPAEVEVTTWDEAIARALQYGEITRQNAIDYYNQRLEQEEKYTDAYHQLWQARQSLLDQQAKEEADRIKAQQDAEKQAAAEAQRAAEEAQRAAEKAAQAQENLIINVYSNSLDPMAVARAIEQAKRMGGLR